jgi:hypothetical protein
MIEAPPTPNVPSAIYIGHQKLARIKLVPLPPKLIVHKAHGEYHSWHGGGCGYCSFEGSHSSSYGSPVDCEFAQPEEFQPYSIRSVLSQLSTRADFPCKYFAISKGKDDFGNIIWEEGCMERCGGGDYTPFMHPCHLANGWMHGPDECPGWVHLANLCQSENERRFLHQYLRVNHDREAPMPIPQAHLEVTERIRVDFVLFVPVTRFEWRWLAVEIDSPSFHKDRQKDEERDWSVQIEGYEVVRLPVEMNMLDQVRDLYKRIQHIQKPQTRHL